jgi:hypothetical protein
VGRDVAPRRIRENEHGNLEFQMRTNVWDVDDTDPGLREWMDALQQGDRIEVYARARLPDWSHIVDWIRVEIFYAW